MVLNRKRSEYVKGLYRCVRECVISNSDYRDWVTQLHKGVTSLPYQASLSQKELNSDNSHRTTLASINLIIVDMDVHICCAGEKGALLRSPLSA